MELETLIPYLNQLGVTTTLTVKQFKDPSLNYPYIDCNKDNIHFEVTKDNISDRAFIFRRVWYEGVLRYSVNRMLSADELSFGFNYFEYWLYYFLNKK